MSEKTCERCGGCPYRFMDEKLYRQKKEENLKKIVAGIKNASPEFDSPVFIADGQRRRADIARGLVNEPQILILDEPTTGLDPQTRRAVWDSVRSLREETGMTVFLTTHYMEEANGSDRVVILDGGKVAAEGTPVFLKNSYSRSYLHLYGDVAAGLEAEGIPFEQEPAGARVAMESAEAARGFLQKYPALCADFEFVKGDMDDVFLAVTGKQLQEGGAV